jgi:hypothetical protein
MNLTLLLIFIVLFLAMVPMVHFVYTQFRITSTDESITRMRRAMLSTNVSALIMLAYLTLLAWEGLIRLNLLGSWTDEIFLAIAFALLYTNWYAFLEFRRFRLLAHH